MMMMLTNDGCNDLIALSSSMTGSRHGGCMVCMWRDGCDRMNLFAKFVFNIVSIAIGQALAADWNHAICLPKPRVIDDLIGKEIVVCYPLLATNRSGTDVGDWGWFVGK